MKFWDDSNLNKPTGGIHFQNRRKVRIGLPRKNQKNFNNKEFFSLYFFVTSNKLQEKKKNYPHLGRSGPHQIAPTSILI